MNVCNLRVALISSSVLLLTSCASPMLTGPSVDARGAVPHATSVDELIQSDIEWLWWGAILCLAGCCATYVLRKYMPFNGVTSKMLLFSAISLGMLRYVLALMLPVIDIVLLSFVATVFIFVVFTKGPFIYALLRDAVHQWYAGSRK